MAGTTTPDGIAFLQTGDTVTPSAESSAQATTIQAAFSQRQIHTFSWVNPAARIAQTGMIEGDTGYQADTDTYYYYNGSAWVSTSAGILRTVPGVSGSGAVLNLDSSITLTGTTVLTLLNCNASFKTIIDLYLPTNTSNTVVMQLASSTGVAESSGTPGTSGKYDTQQLSGSAATASAGQGLKQTGFTITNGAPSAIHAFQVVLFGANASSTTSGTALSMNTQSPMTTSTVLVMNGMNHQDAIAYPSLVFTFSAAASGTIKVSQG